jgi:DNA-binding NtrC family response regulator
MDEVPSGGQAWRDDDREGPALKRLLFVDDEPRVLDGLRGMLRTQRREWEMVFMTSPEQALAEFERLPFDLVVSDVRMPGMDGVALLGEIGARSPWTLRFALSGQSDVESDTGTVPTAHHFIAKPCEPAAMRALLVRACELHDRLVEVPHEAQVDWQCLLPEVSALVAQVCRGEAPVAAVFEDWLAQARTALA